MKRIFIALALIVSSPVLADTSDGTRGFGGTNMDNGAGVYSGRIFSAGKAQTYSPWSDAFVPFGSANTGVVTGAGLQNSHISTVPAKELAAQIKRNEAARGQYDDYGNAPFEYSAPFIRAFQQGGSN